MRPRRLGTPRKRLVISPSVATALPKTISVEKGSCARLQSGPPRCSNVNSYTPDAEVIRGAVAGISGTSSGIVYLRRSTRNTSWITGPQHALGSISQASTKLTGPTFIRASPKAAPLTTASPCRQQDPKTPLSLAQRGPISFNRPTRQTPYRILSPQVSSRN